VPTRAYDWLRQARRDLDHAREDLKSGYYEWGCFSAQQAAEKAVKALYQHLHAEAWGHSVRKLLESLPESHKCSQEIIESGASLDKFYIPTRYPNGFDVGAPEDYYLRKDLEEAIIHAESIIRFCQDKLPGS
jgi:HEPN domain-containing protein